MVAGVGVIVILSDYSLRSKNKVFERELSHLSITTALLR